MERSALPRVRSGSQSDNALRSNELRTQVTAYPNGSTDASRILTSLDIL
jgi:hypothetical protein